MLIFLVLVCPKLFCPSSKSVMSKIFFISKFEDCQMGYSQRAGLAAGLEFIAGPPGTAAD
jgi:hypothetical protein